MSEWQPIETVPSDVARIMAYDGERVGEMESYTDYTEADDFMGSQVWRWANDSCSCCWYTPAKQPTHWMCVPEPPK